MELPVLGWETVSAFLTLTLMEIILGIDNIIFIAIVVAKLPKQSQARIRTLGLAAALLLRIGLLFTITWIMGLTEPFLSVGEMHFSGRDLILIAGGLFLLVKSTQELHEKVVQLDKHKKQASIKVNRKWVILQIIILDLVFSFDSVLTAVGMANNVVIMVAAMLIAVGMMLVAAGKVSSFVEKHPTVKVLALAFLLLIGVMLIMEGMGQHVPKGYVYFAVFFALGVEMINLRVRKIG